MLKFARKQVVSHYTQIIFKNISKYLSVWKIQNNCICCAWIAKQCNQYIARKSCFMEHCVDEKCLKLNRLSKDIKLGVIW